jgi:antiviral helicase SLH1
MSRVDLPISDYVGDQTSVLDQGIRIIQSSIDVLAELGYLPACRMMMTLLQCIKSARWPEDHPLSILPSIEPDTIKPKSGLPDSLIALTSTRASDLIQKFSKTSARLSVPQLDKVISALPRVSISLADISPTGMTLTITRQNPSTTPDFKIYAPRFPKPQTEGYFLIITGEINNEIIALKRVSWSSKNNTGNRNKNNTSGQNKRHGPAVTARATIKFQDDSSSGSTRKVNVRLISDAYVGMEWTLNGIEVPTADMAGPSSGAKTVEVAAQVEK